MVISVTESVDADSVEVLLKKKHLAYPSVFGDIIGSVSRELTRYCQSIGLPSRKYRQDCP